MLDSSPGASANICANSLSRCCCSHEVFFALQGLRISIVRNITMKQTRKVWVLCLTAASIVTMQAADNSTVTAIQLNGTYKKVSTGKPVFRFGNPLR
jgi:hypothetical protein